MSLALAALPLWVTQSLPMVDLPQHLHLISVLHRLDDATTLYPQMFARRSGLTPYLGYYYLVHLLNWLLPLRVANQVFLTAYVVGMPWALGFLLRSLGRPRWPAVLAIPFAYGDSFAWGFVNYCAALPLGFLSCGLFIRAIRDPSARRHWSILHALALVSVLLFHVQVFGFLAVALPLLLLTTRAPEDPLGKPGWAAWRARVPALVSVVPGVTLFLLWVVVRVGEPTEVAQGEPWKAWGPMLSPQNLSYRTFPENWSALFVNLADLLRNQADRWGLWAVLAVAVAALIVSMLPAGKRAVREGPVERFRMLALAVIAGVLYFTLPFDIRGYMYSLNQRFAHLLAPLLLAAIPVVAAKWRPWLLAGGAAAALVVAVPLAVGFHAFGEEAAALEGIAATAGARPRVMGLVYDRGSAVMTHPVYLHAGAVLAREGGGFTNFSFASTPHSPLKWKDAAPPTFPSEWSPQDFNYATMGPAYDTFLVRGPRPEQVFGALLQSELEVRAHAAGFWLIQRRHKDTP